MEKIYDLEGFRIKVVLENGLIRVFSDAELWRFLNGKANVRFELLVNTVKTAYLLEFDKALSIENDSLLVEILVHVYCDYLGLRFNQVIKIKWITKLVNKLLIRAEIVDCGEKSLDGNRWFWDLLAGLKTFFIRIFPKNLRIQQLKHTN
ncbi:hypothetical protein [Pedobacter mucosus]|uniref:hypothetical protein n=1 Tax=Pedobacter mucosus TaxID=2895286 RepID=UPI001EE4C65C|nr:hypothetical protein [Pedobacter mucosus]UKT65337.1 hypothetical protein LOK61_06030 [Pedobacter mucosus]